MRLSFALLVPVAVLATAIADADVPGYGVEALPSPAGRGAMAPVVATSADGKAWLAWMEPLAPSSTCALRVAVFDETVRRWKLAPNPNGNRPVMPSNADLPQLAIDGRGTTFAVWRDTDSVAWWSRLPAAADAWTPAERWSTAPVADEKFALSRLADGRVLAAWLRAPVKGAQARPTQLVARVMGIAEQPDEIIDERVCDCCQIGLAPFLDTGVLVAYRGRTDDEVRDIHVARRRYGRWDAPRVLSIDDWHLAACPINGPRLATDGSRVAAAWFTAAGDDPRVLASYSPDAGARWLMPLRVDIGHPVGHVETIFLRDGAFLVFWVEADGGLWLRRISPEFSATEPRRLAAGVSARAFPRAALVQDYSGARGHARVLLAYVVDSTVKTCLVDVPEGDLVNAERNCECAPPVEELEGFPIRGRVLDLDPKMQSAQVTHEEVPGVFERGTHVFGVAAADFPTIQRGRRFLGRVLWKEGAWRLSSVRLLAEPAR